MPRTEKQFEEIRENRKTLIMDTALELFANEGYHPTSISRIAKKAGISKGLMYNYFTSKEALIRAIIDKGLNDLLTTFDPDHDGVLTEKEFEYMVNGLIAILKENVRYWKLYFSIIIQPHVHPIIHEGIVERMPKWLRIQAKYFEKKGVADPVTEALFLGSVLDGVALNYVIDPGHFPIDKVKELIIRTFSLNKQTKNEN